MSDLVPIIEHIGIAVNSLEQAIPTYRAVYGGDPERIVEVDGEGVRVAFFGEGPGRIELLEPTEPESPVARFLDRRGPGMHHVCVRVPDLLAALERCERQGLEVLPPRVRTGADGHRVAFLHPGSTAGVLLELSESASESGPGG